MLRHAGKHMNKAAFGLFFLPEIIRTGIHSVGFIDVYSLFIDLPVFLKYHYQEQYRGDQDGR